MRNTKAFTLAELLIAMFMFAMLAALLIPKVTNNAEKQLFTTQLKKIQNDVQQAMLLMLAQNQGTLQLVCTSAADKSKCFVNEIGKKLEHTTIYSYADQNDNCETLLKNPKTINKLEPKNQYCVYQNRQPQYINGISASYKVNGKDNNFNAINLKNGATVSVVFNPKCNLFNSNNNSYPTSDLDEDLKHLTPDKLKPAGEVNAEICGYMEIDTNAGKVPNMVGKDIHYFWIVDKDGIVPFGEIDIFTCANKQKNVKQGDTPLATLGCTYRLLQKGTIDYFD